MRTKRSKSNAVTLTLGRTETGSTSPPSAIQVTPFFRWYDLWVGAYVDTKGRALYVCPVPMFGVKIQWR